MSYSSYISKLKSNKDQISELNENINKIDFASIWEGKAYTKQKDNIKNLNTATKKEVENITNLIDTLTNIDKYDELEKNIKEYQSRLNNLDKDSENYASEASDLNSKIKKAKEEKEALKKKIDSSIDLISSNYSTQYTVIPKTEVQKTDDVLKKLNDLKTTLSSSFTIQPGNGDKTSSANAGEITLDKQGIFYDKEPTPGKSAQKLHVYHNGQRLYDKACITIKKGATIRLTVNLSDNAGEIKQLTRTTADGYRDDNNHKNDWTNWFSAHSEPYVNRYDKSTFLETDNFDWVITADKVTKGYVTLSQTTFHSTNEHSEFKSMYTIRVKVVE